MKTAEELDVVAQGERELVITRAFEAPRAEVYDAWTKPERLKRWLGVFGNWRLDECKVDLKPGGTVRYVWRGDGREMGMTQYLREVVPGERIVCTEHFDEPWYAGEAVCTLDFTEAGGKTVVINTMLYESRAIRDKILDSGMAGGIAASYDGLARLLSSED